MVALMVVSSQVSSGKTAVAIGLGRKWLEEGRKVGFLKPVVGGWPSSGAAGEAEFVKQTLGLTEDVKSTSPPLDGGKGLADRAREVYIEASQNKDVVIIEGYCGTKSDDAASRTAYEIAGALKAKVIIVEGYYRHKSGPQYPDSYKGFGGDLLGLVLNRVPQKLLKSTRDELSAGSTGKEVRLLGVLPEDRTLVSFTVGELAQQVKGQVLNNAEKSTALVENVVVGAMCVDSGIDYFSRKGGKAAVVSKDRPDMQMAALETATRCLVISGGGEPIDYVRLKADEKDVPLITTPDNTDTVISRIEELLDGTRFHQEKKLARLAEVLKSNLDFKAINAGLGMLA